MMKMDGGTGRTDGKKEDKTAELIITYTRETAIIVNDLATTRLLQKSVLRDRLIDDQDKIA